MKQVTNEDFDQYLLQMEKILESEEEDRFGLKEYDFGLGFRIELPHEFTAAGKEEAAGVFLSEQRPSAVLFTKGKTEGITFQIVEEGQTDTEPWVYIEKIRDIIEQIDNRTVFYQTGDENAVRASWMEYKSFASKERIYNMVFLFQAKERMILGTFYCLFRDYGRWKPAMLHTLKTIKTEETEDERI